MGVCAMGMTKIQNHRASMIVLRRETRDADNVLKIVEREIKSGANNVDADEIAEYRKNPNVERFFEDGVLVDEGAPATPDQESLPKHGGDLSKLKEKAALRTVAACKDIRQLQIWIKQDGRDVVRDALIERHAELTKGEADNEAAE